MAFQRSQNSQSAGPTSASYHTIYCGVATDRAGLFDHFIRRVDSTHKEYGYWRFDSRLDEHRAYQRGFTTPEDLLCSVNDGDGTHEDITLRWQPGQADTNMWGPRIGSAAQHLKGIYDARYFLNKTLALRGQIPIYPADPRLEGYWKPDPSRHVVGPTAGPASSPLVSARVPSPMVGAYSESLRAPSGSPVPQSSALHASVKSPSHASTDSPAQSPSARFVDSPSATPSGSTPSLSSHMPTLAPQSLRPIAAQDSRDSNPIRSHYASQAPITQSHYSTRPPPTSQTGPVQNTQSQQAPLQRTMSTVRPVSLQHQTHARHAQPAHGPRSSLLPQFRGGEINATRSNPITGNHYSSPYGPQLNTSYQSPFGGLTPPSTPLPGSSFVSQDCQVDAQAPSLTGGALAHQETCNKSPHNEAFAVARPQNLIDRHTPAHSPEDVADDDMPIPIAQEIQSDSSGSVSPRTSSRSISTTPQYETPVMPKTELPSQKVNSLKRPVEADRNEPRQVKKSRSDSNHSDTHALSPQAVPSSASFTDMCQDLPCMECGEDGGHTSDCYVGNIKPMENLTFLDYRAFADCTQYHDPGPWTDHQGSPPEPVPESTEDQLRGMAAIIRNEDCYKNDPELHALPDDFMITLWALKTCSDTEVVCDFADDSGIGESEPE